MPHPRYYTVDTPTEAVYNNFICNYALCLLGPSDDSPGAMSIEQQALCYREDALVKPFHRSGRRRDTLAFGIEVLLVYSMVKLIVPLSLV